MTCRGPLLAFTGLLAGCPGALFGDSDTTSSGGDTDGATTTTGTDTATQTEGTTGPLGLDEAAGDLLSRLPGIWIAPVESTTSVGDFPFMVMDIRTAGERTLFARTDFYGGHATRFSFSRETHHDEDVLVFRNSGLFGSMQFDARTELVEATAQSYRWCAIDGGCSAIEADLVFGDDDALTLDVKVAGTTHMHWAPHRGEEVPTSGGIAEGANPPDAALPGLPSLRATLSWDPELAEPADVWLILSTRPCGIPPGCTPSRFLSAEAPVGATEIDIEMVQLHPGDYYASAILDRNRNAESTLTHDPGDEAPLSPKTVIVPPTGEATVAIEIDIQY